MQLAIARKSYLYQQVAKPEFHSTLAKIKQALKAFETHNRHLGIKALYQAYSLLPKDNHRFQVCADIMEALLHMEAYTEVARIARELEEEYYGHYFEGADIHFALFRIFANAAEALREIGEASQARRLSKIALDHQLETQESIDLEMLQLFNRLGERQDG